MGPAAGNRAPGVRAAWPETRMASGTGAARPSRLARRAGQQGSGCGLRPLTRPIRLVALGTDMSAPGRGSFYPRPSRSPLIPRPSALLCVSVFSFLANGLCGTHRGRLDGGPDADLDASRPPSVAAAMDMVSGRPKTPAQPCSGSRLAEACRRAPTRSSDTALRRCHDV